MRPQIITAPTNNRKDHCTYPGRNYQGGDLTTSQGGNGLETEDPAQCANECEKRSSCQYWTFVDKWKVNCYLKASFDEQSEKEGATSGSIGVRCDAGSVDIASLPKKTDEEVETAAPPAAAAKKVISIARRKVAPKNPQSQPDNVCFFKVRIHFLMECTDLLTVNFAGNKPPRRRPAPFPGRRGHRD